MMEYEELTRKIIGCAYKVFNYLKGVKRDIGLLINFGPSGVEVKRKYQAFDIEK